MDPEHVMFEHPVEFYQELHSDNVKKAIGWQNGINITEVEFPEPDLKGHFMAIWGEDCEEYRNTIERWRGYGPLTNLTVLTSKKSDEKAFVVDTSDLVIGKTDDEFFFYMIGTCWAVVVDVDAGENGSLRVAFHLPGITANKDNSLGELMKVLAERGKLSKLTIFYNSEKHDEAPEMMVKHALSEGLPTRFVDMNELDDVGVHDLFVKGNRAVQYYNRGEYNDVTGKAKVWRSRSGVHSF